MLESGDWIVPHLNGRPYLDKPPLLYWLTALSYSQFGMGDVSARLVPSLAAFATVVIVFFWGRCIAGSELGFTAAAILALMPQFVYRGRWLSFDTLLCLWVTLSLATAHIASVSQRFWPWWMISALSAGLGLLTKGPVVLVLVGVPLFASRWILTTGGKFTILRWIVWIVVAGMVAAGWFIAMSNRHPEFIEYFFWKHHVERYVTPFDHQKHFWFYLPELLFGLIPWIGLVPGMVKWCWKCQPGNSIARFTALTALWCVVFFSISGSKRATYILPCFPALALSLALYLTTQLSRKAFLMWCRCGMLTWLVLLGLIIFWWPIYTHKFSMRDVLEPQREHLLKEDVVICYPRMWDGVPFYLRRSDVQVYGGNEMQSMIAEIQQASRALLIVKTAQAHDVINTLPMEIQHQEVTRNSEVVILRVGAE